MKKSIKKSIKRKGLFFIFIFFLVQSAVAEKNNFEWQTATPESRGMSYDRLDAAIEILAEKGTKKLLVIKNDRIVCEWYAPGDGPEKRYYTASLAKALVGGMSLLVALNNGCIFEDAPACNYIPEWKEYPEKSKITIRHLATHSSGIENAEQEGFTHMEIPGWKGAFWRKEPDPFSISRDNAPVIFTPGTQYAYSNPGMAMLAYAVTASLKETTYKVIRSPAQVWAGIPILTVSGKGVGRPDKRPRVVRIFYRSRRFRPTGMDN